MFNIMNKQRLLELAGIQLDEESQGAYTKQKWDKAMRYLADVAIQDANDALQDMSPEDIKNDLLRTAKDYVDDASAGIRAAIEKKLKD